MKGEIIVALISGLCVAIPSIIATISANKKNNDLVLFRINELDEKVRVINMNEGYTYIYPNMFIDTKNVVANHAASITNISKDYLFYLNSKGIKDEEAINMIINGFLENIAR